MIKTTKSHVFSAALLATLVAACGQNKKETVYVQQPQTTTPTKTDVLNQGQNQNPPKTNQDPALEADKLAVKFTNFEALNTTIQNGTPATFGLVNPNEQSSTTVFTCTISGTTAAGAPVSKTDRCQSPYALQSLQDGSYTLKVTAAKTALSPSGLPAQVGFALGAGQTPPVVNNGQAGQPGQGGFGGQPGMGGQPGIGGQPGPVPVLPKQVGDMFLVNVPAGMHTVYQSSTFDQPGFLKFRMIDAASNADNAAPYPYSCGQGAFDRLIPDMSPSGQMLNYCEITPAINYLDPANPWTNSFRFMNMNTMSYNSLAIASDNSLDSAVPPGASPVLAKMYINVFTNPTGEAGGYQSPFSNELSQTVSRLQIACGAQTPQYLGDAPTFQGFFTWSVAVTPLFGCVNPRGGQWYVDIAAFPMDHVTPLLPSVGWGPWITQNFQNVRAAEIVSEIGPFFQPPIPMMVAPDAQAMMVQHIKKLLPN